MIEILERTKEFKAETALVVEGKEITYSDLHLQSDLIASYPVSYTHLRAHET